MMDKKMQHFAASLKVDPSAMAPMSKMMGAEREWMEPVEAALQKSWGGVDGYVKWLGIDAAKVDAYKAAMLE